MVAVLSRALGEERETMQAKQNWISAALLIVILLATAADSQAITIRHDVADSEYESSAEIRDELKAAIGEIQADNSPRHQSVIGKPNGKGAVDEGADIPMYDVDSGVRRAVALQLTPAARRGRGAVI